MLTKRSLLSLAIIGAFSTAAWAAGMPGELTYQSTRYVTGGIGSDEAEAMRAAASDYSLAMTFAAQTGQFVNDVDVAVKKPSGEVVLQANDAAPMLLADLPAGRYQIEATYDGQTQTRNVAVANAGTTKVVMQWQVPGLQSDRERVNDERASIVPGS
jgi:hypothetical protein